MKKTILFDLDGTLTDSGEGIIKCASLALEHFGLPVPDWEEMRTFVGPPLGDSFIRHGVPEERVEEAIAVYRSRYIPVGKFENHPYPGIRELLEQLKQQGHTLFVATSKPEAMSIEILEHFDLAKYFQQICGATMDGTRSSKASVIEYLIDGNGRDSRMVMVGDTKFDILGAKAHGIPAVGVAWGYGEISDMRAAGAAAIAENPQQLLEILTQM